jgi:hypothetical protein
VLTRLSARQPSACVSASGGTFAGNSKPCAAGAPCGGATAPSLLPSMATPRRIQQRTPLLDASAAVRLRPRLMRPPTPNGNESRGSCWQRRSQPARTRSARRLIRRAPTNLSVSSPSSRLLDCCWQRILYSLRCLLTSLYPLVVVRFANRDSKNNRESAVMV